MTRRIVGFDCETDLIQPGQVYPALACVTLSDGNRDRLLSAAEGVSEVEVLLDAAASGSVVLVGANVAYDVGVVVAEAQATLPAREADEVHELAWRAYDAGGISDVQVREMLLDIAAGDFAAHSRSRKEGYSLASCVRRRCGRELAKGDDTWRLHYAALRGVPVDRWPAGARRYAVLDAVEAREVYLAQGLILAEDALEEFPDERLQVRAAWALHLMATYGVRADQEAVESLRGSLGARRAKAEEALRQAGILRADGTRDMGRVRSIVEGALGEDTPRTPTGLVQVGEDALIAAAEAVGDASADSPTLRHLAEIASTNVVWTTWVPPLEAAVRAPLTTRPNVLLETGRTSWWGPNMQNPPRKGGVRECFVPRPGFVYCDCDYDTIELCALAQVLLERFGRSRMAEDIQAGRDLHLGLAADLLGISYEEAARRYEEGDPSVEAARQAAKAANFGFPGGMGVAKFLIAQAAFIPRGLGPAEANAWATSLRDAWFRRYPEMRSYFAWCAELADVGMVTHPWSGRVRGGVRFTEVANGFFQGRVADGAKLALYRLTRECLVGSAPLLGSRPVLFLHDEVLAEVPEERAHEAGEAMAAVMVAAMQEVIPDVPVKSKPTLMRRWHKGAKPVRVGGRLVPSRPLVVDGKTRWVEDTKEAA